jgi:hypothetical protein
MALRYLILVLLPLVCAIHVEAAASRDYNQKLTSTDRAIIADIVNQLAYKSPVSLAFKRSELERKGAQIYHVHPLRHLGFLFGDPTLRQKMRIIWKRSVIWPHYREGLANGFAQEYMRNNITEAQIQEFTRFVQVDPSRMLMLAAQQQWHQLIEYLSAAAP